MKINSANNKDNLALCLFFLLAVLIFIIANTSPTTSSSNTIHIHVTVAINHTGGDSERQSQELSSIHSIIPYMLIKLLSTSSVTVSLCLLPSITPII